MMCGCKIGGAICAACRQSGDLQKQLLALAKRVVDLEEAFLSQARLVGELAAHVQSEEQKP